MLHALAFYRPIPPMANVILSRCDETGRWHRQYLIGRRHCDATGQHYIVYADGSWRRCDAAGQLTPRQRRSKKQRIAARRVA